MDGIDNPYPGLRPFRADETHLFFGRDEQRIELLRRLRGSRFLAIVGTSGSGKSSLVRAGLLPGLHGGFMAGQPGRWRVVDLRPGTDAIGNLARALDAPGALRDAPPPEDEPSFTEATLLRSGLGLVDAVREARLPKAEKVLVLVDQFEELFRAIEATDRPQSADDASAFVKLLLEAAQQDDLPIYVVLTMRSDFLGECARWRDLPEAINDGQYLVPRLTRDQRREAVTGPAAVFGVALASTLVNRLLNDVGDNPDQLPILQHALMRTWDHWQCRAAAGKAALKEIGLADYEAIGGMARALSLHTDAVFDDLAPPAQLIAEKLFKSLAGVGAGGLAVRRLASLQEIVDVTGAPAVEVVAVVDAFRAPGNSFLMPPINEQLTAERHIDISHESLIRNWQRMKAWGDDEAESARVYERLSLTALLHAKGEAGLWEQPDLGVALKWRAAQRPNAAWARRYNAAFEPAMAFLTASRTRSEEAEDAAATRHRRWVFNAAWVFFAIVAGLLTWVRDDLSRVNAMARRAGAASATLQTLDDIVELHRASTRSDAAARVALLCARYPSPGVLSDRARMLGTLCQPGGRLNPQQREWIGFYERLLDGRWGEATSAISQIDGDRAEGLELLGELASVRWPADSSERARLLELRDRRSQAKFPTPDERQALLGSFAHPVHRRIAKAFVDPENELTMEEALLLDAYESATDRPSSSVGIKEANPRQVKFLIENLRTRPLGRAYGDLAESQLSPASKVIDAFETGGRLLRHQFAGPSFVLIPPAMLVLWPGWRLWRWIQLRTRRPIRTRPHALRSGSAALFDFGIAVGVGTLAANVIGSVVAIVAVLLMSWSVIGARPDAHKVAFGFCVGVAYMLCRDAVRLRFARSIGKALFDLRPLTVGATQAGGMTLRASIRRNAIWAVFAGLSVGVYLTSMNYYLEPGWVRNATSGVSHLVATIPILVLSTFLLGDVVLSGFRDRETLLGRWSRTRLVDADSAESLAIRP